jgi:AcrR family transcriptional regulator
MARPRSIEAQQEMLRAARQILLHDGVSAFTIDEVARRSGVAKSTIYRHFSNGDALILAAVDGLVNDLPVPDHGSLREDLREILARYLKIAESPASRQLFAWMLARSVTDPEFATAFRRVRAQPGGPTVIALQRAIARGEVSPTLDLGLALHLVQGPLISKRFVENEAVTAAELEWLLDALVAALGSPRHASMPGG